MDRTRQIEAVTPHHARLVKGQVQRTRKILGDGQGPDGTWGQDGSNGTLSPRRRAGGLGGGRPPEAHHSHGVELWPEYYLWRTGAHSSSNRLYYWKETWMEDAASRIAAWIERGGRLGQSERVLWSATNKLEWESPANTKTLSIPRRRSSGGSPLEHPPLVPQVKKVVADFRLLGGPKAIWARAAAAALANQDKKTVPWRSSGMRPSH